MSFLNMRRYETKPTLHGRLQRQGKTWHLPIDDTEWRWIVCDEIFPGDLIILPETRMPRDVWLRLVFSSGRLFKCGPRAFTYQLPARTGCPECGRIAVHDMEIPARRQKPDNDINVQRRCVCEYSWLVEAVWPHTAKPEEDM